MITHYFPEVKISFEIYSRVAPRNYFSKANGERFTSEKRAKAEYRKMLKRAIKELQDELKAIDKE